MQAISNEVNFPVVSGSLPSHTASPSVGPSAANVHSGVVYLVDGDPKAAEEISAYLAPVEVEVIAFATIKQYLECSRADVSSCLILDLPFPDRHGLDVRCEVAAEACPPVVFICSHIDIASAVRVMKAGAIELLTKPVDHVALIDAVRIAFTQDRKLRQRRAESAKLQQRLLLLTPREREVLPLIVGGLLNKQAASVLGISEVTLQIHRSQVMRKMQADSLADLVRMAVKLRIPFWYEVQPRPNPRVEVPMVGTPHNFTGRRAAV